MRYAALILMCAAFLAPVAAHAQHDGPFDFPTIVGDKDPHIGPKKGETCLKDCKQRKAGYAWAAKEDVGEADECPSKNQFFHEGCMQWLNEQIAAEEKAP